MNPKSPRKNSAKPTPKKKGKNNAKVNPTVSETKFYITEDDKVSEQQKKDEQNAIVEEPKKLERSNSFHRTLSKFYSKLSSKENLDKAKVLAKDNNQIPKVEPSPYKFQRSLTLNSFQLKKNNRKTFPDSRLEKLSEEKICDNEAKNKSPPMSPLATNRSQSPSTHRQSLPPDSFGSTDYSILKPPSKLERSNSFISIIKRKISFVEPKMTPMTSNWATSRQNLQQIDNMVSYEDLSFLDYDKFNQYELQIDKKLARHQQTHSELPMKSGDTVDTSGVRRRVKKPINQPMGDVGRNLDREKNLYRQSIDSNKLRILSSFNADSYRWSQVCNKNPVDYLSLENPVQ